MLKNYFSKLYRYILHQKEFTKISFWCCMIDVDHNFPIEVVTLIIVKAIEDIFPNQYKPNYYNGILDVLATGAIAYASVSEEEAFRYSIINDFTHHCSKSEALQVVKKALDYCDRYEKLIPYI